MDSRQTKVLQAIVKAFIETASPIGSKQLCETGNFDVSSATIRNEMVKLEKDGFIMQPHTSAGRVPTSLAYRMFVDQMKVDSRLIEAQRDIEKVRRDKQLKQTKEVLHEMVSTLSSVTHNITFASLPDQDRVFYIGLSNMFRMPEFSQNPDITTKVIEIFENQISELLIELEIGADGVVYIGEENILPEFQSCSLLAYPYVYKGFNGVLGILGSTRMDYAYNMAALKSSVQMLNN